MVHGQIQRGGGGGQRFWTPSISLGMGFAMAKLCWTPLRKFSGSELADPEGVQGVCSNPPLELNYFIFMGNFRKNEAKLVKRHPL